MTTQSNRRINKKISCQKNTTSIEKKNSKGKPVGDVSGRPSSNKNKQGVIHQEEISKLDEMAVENLIKISKSLNSRFDHFNPVLPSKDLIESSLRCENCLKAPDAEYVQLFINCLYTGNYSPLAEYEKEKIKKDNQNSSKGENQISFNEENQISSIEDNQNSCKEEAQNLGKEESNNVKEFDHGIIEVSEKNRRGKKFKKEKKTKGTSGKKLKKERINKTKSEQTIKSEPIIKLETESTEKKIVRRKSAVPVMSHKIVNDDSSEESSVYKRKIKKRKTKNEQKSKINENEKKDEQFIIKFSVDTNPVQKRKYKSRQRLVLNNSPSNEIDDSDNKEIVDYSNDDKSDVCESEIKLTQINKKEGLTSKLKEDKIRSSYNCDFCGDLFTSRNGLNYHIKFVHSEEKLKVVKPFPCPFSECSKKYKNKNGLYYHLVHHHSDDVDDIEVLYAECVGTKKA
ncbi:hypothetical protein P3W45_000585 [Vairimorpha bombi]|jgi:hypothetical protein